jgi:Tol biopolymer transport system component
MVGRRPDEHGNFVIHVYVMSADGSDVRRVSESGTPFQVFGGVVGRSAGSPVWLPDGSGLYYHTLGGDGREIRRFALDGFGETRVVADGLSPAVAKDGRIAFVRPQPREGMDDFDVLTRTGRIFSVTADGADLRPRATSSGAASPPTSTGAPGAWCATDRRRSRASLRSTFRAVAGHSPHPVPSERSSCRTASSG